MITSLVEIVQEEFKCVLHRCMVTESVVNLRDGKYRSKIDTKGKKDSPGPATVSDTLCPAVHILGTFGSAAQEEQGPYKANDASS